MSFNRQFRTCGGKRRRVGFSIYPNHQPMGFTVTAPSKIANTQPAELACDI
jgi:hypothetical protein